MPAVKTGMGAPMMPGMPGPMGGMAPMAPLGAPMGAPMGGMMPPMGAPMQPPAGGVPMGAQQASAYQGYVMGAPRRRRFGDFLESTLAGARRGVSAGPVAADTMGRMDVFSGQMLGGQPMGGQPMVGQPMMGGQRPVGMRDGGLAGVQYFEDGGLSRVEQLMVEKHGWTDAGNGMLYSPGGLLYDHEAGDTFSERLVSGLSAEQMGDTETTQRMAPPDERLSVGSTLMLQESPTGRVSVVDTSGGGITFGDIYSGAYSPSFAEQYANYLGDDSRYGSVGLSFADEEKAKEFLSRYGYGYGGDYVAPTPEVTDGPVSGPVQPVAPVQPVQPVTPVTPTITITGAESGPGSAVGAGGNFGTGTYTADYVDPSQVGEIDYTQFTGDIGRTTGGYDRVDPETGEVIRGTREQAALFGPRVTIPQRVSQYMTDPVTGGLTTSYGPVMTAVSPIGAINLPARPVSIDIFDWLSTPTYGTMYSGRPLVPSRMAEGGIAGVRYMRGGGGADSGQAAAEADMGLDPFGGEGPSVGGSSSASGSSSGASSGGKGGGGADSGQAAAAADRGEGIGRDFDADMGVGSRGTVTLGDLMSGNVDVQGLPGGGSVTVGRDFGLDDYGIGAAQVVGLSDIERFGPTGSDLGMTTRTSPADITIDGRPAAVVDTPLGPQVVDPFAAGTRQGGVTYDVAPISSGIMAGLDEALADVTSIPGSAPGAGGLMTGLDESMVTASEARNELASELARTGELSDFAKSEIGSIYGLTEAQIEALANEVMTSTPSVSTAGDVMSIDITEPMDVSGLTMANLAKQYEQYRTVPNEQTSRMIQENLSRLSPTPTKTEDFLGTVLGQMTLGLITPESLAENRVSGAEQFLKDYKEQGEGGGGTNVETELEDGLLGGEGGDQLLEESVVDTGYTTDANGNIVCNTAGYVYDAASQSCKPASDVVTPVTPRINIPRRPVSFQDVLGGVSSPQVRVKPLADGGMAGLNTAADAFLRAMAG